MKKKQPKTLKDFFFVTFLESMIVGMYFGVYLTVLMIRHPIINNFWVFLLITISILGVPTFFIIDLVRSYKKFSKRFERIKTQLGEEP